MSFAPALPFGGVAGWRYLQGQGTALRDAHAASPSIARAGQAFADAAPSMADAADVTGDRRLREVALTAFGLQEDMPNTYFVERVLEEGATDADALSRRLADGRYREMAAAFGFDAPGRPGIAAPGAAADIRARYEAQAFEAAIGESQPDLRLALAMDRELSDLARSDLSADGKWFTIMGTPPLRAVMERALGLPGAIGSLDVYRQLDEFRDAARRVLGHDDLSRFADAGERDRLAVRYLALGTALDGSAATSSGQVALALLGG